MSDTTRTTTVVTYAGAAAAVAAGIAKAEELGVEVCVAVVDAGGYAIAFGAMDDSPLLSRDVARDKGWTAVAFGRPTDWWADLLAASPELAALGKNNRLMPVPAACLRSSTGPSQGQSASVAPRPNRTPRSLQPRCRQ